MIGGRFGVSVGPRVGVAVGMDADEITPPSGGIAGVTRDAAWGKYYPANSTEMALLLAAAGDAAGNFTSIWGFQDAAISTFADSVGTTTLMAGTAPMYQSPVSGATRFCYRGIDGGLVQAGRNIGGPPAPDTNSALILCDVDLPASPPAATRDVLGTTTNVMVQYTTTGRLSLVNGSTVNTVAVHTGKHPLVLRVDINASLVTMLTDLEIVTATFATPSPVISFVGFGIVGGTQGNIGYMWGAEVFGSPAQRSNAQIRSILQTRGYTVAW